MENTFGHYLDLWLKIKANSVAASSYRGYANKAEVYVRPRWGKVQINAIDHLDLQEWIQGTLSKTLKNKTIRDIISNVRQVFRLYRTRMKVAHDPTEGLMVRLPDPEAPDPFTRAEIKQILEPPHQPHARAVDGSVHDLDRAPGIRDHRPGLGCAAEDRCIESKKEGGNR